MKVVKYILQIIVALLYSGIFSGLVIIAVAVPIGYVLSRPWWAIILILFVLGGIIWNLIEGILKSFIVLITCPFAWIVKNNTVSLILSILTIVINFVIIIVKIWQIPINGTWNTIVTIIISLSLVGVGISLIQSLIALRLRSDEE